MTMTTTTPYADFLAQYAPPRLPNAASLDLDAGAVIRLTRRADDSGYEAMVFSSSSQASAPPTQPSAKKDEPTITTVKRGADALAALNVRPALRRAAKLRRAQRPPR
jgi:hypothetical protein